MLYSIPYEEKIIKLRNDKRRAVTKSLHGSDFFPFKMGNKKGKRNEKLGTPI